MYKTLIKGNAPVARITVGESKTLSVSTTEVQVKGILQSILKRKALVGEWQDDTLIKREPRNLEEAVVTRLKRFLHRPYFASKNVPENFTPTHEIRVEVA